MTAIEPDIRPGTRWVGTSKAHLWEVRIVHVTKRRVQFAILSNTSKSKGYRPVMGIDAFRQCYRPR